MTTRTTKIVAGAAGLGAVLAFVGLAPNEHVASAFAGAGAAPGAGLDLVFSIDGSGSIDPVDFDTQKQAIRSALAAAELFPPSGTTRVGVVQWAGGATRTELAMTALASSTDVVTASTAVDSMSQLGGGTNAGEGIQAAAALLAGGTAAKQAICVTTDGTNNTGIGPDEAATAAVAQGVDRIAFATLEDSGAFNEASALAGYSTAVRDAEVIHSRTPSEFSAVLPSACLRPEVTAVGFEATQGIQNWKNTVPVVAGRKTIVRAFLQPTQAGIRFPYGARLRGYRSGTELPGSPLVAANAGGQVTLSDNVATRRATPDASLNFTLPDTWTTGDVQLKLDAAGARTTCGTQCEASMPFRTQKNLDLKIVAMPYLKGLSVVGPSDGDLDEQGRRIYSTLPVPEVAYSTARMLPVTTAPSTTAALTRLRAARVLDGCWGSCKTLYYGALQEEHGGGIAAGIPGNTAVGYIGSDNYARNRGPHEIAHLLGRPHAVRGGATGTPPLKSGACGEVADATSESFPTFGTVNGAAAAVLGPEGAADTENWGVDVRFFPGNAALGVISPRDTTELMSYCSASGAQGRWPSAHTWSSILDARTSGGGSSGDGTAGSWDLAAGDLVVQGTVNTTTGAVQLDPVTLVRSGYAPDVVPGAYTLVQRDAAGAVIASTPFVAEELDRDIAAPGQIGAEPNLATFAVPVPQNSALAQIDVTRGGSVLVTRKASAHAPQIAITSPRESESLSGDVAVSWTGSDADGDALTYSAQYSPDDGATWTTLSTFQKDVKLTIPASALAGSTKAAIKIIASDGLRSTAAGVRFLTVPDKAPTVTIVSPRDGDVVSGAQSVVLDATARDLEDGPLPDGSISWTSDRDGALGTGAQLTVPADKLAEGDHVVTVAGLDSAGHEATATVRIMVRRVAAPDNQAPVIASATVSGPVAPGATATLTASFSDPDAGDAHTVTVDWGDGTPATTINAPAGEVQASATHSWAKAGVYPVTITVSDGRESVSTTTTATVTSKPIVSPTVTSTVTGTAFAPRTTLSTPRLNVGTGSQLMVLSVSAGSSIGRAQSVAAVSGGGLSWSLVSRKTSSAGTAEVWKAYAKKAFRGQVTARLKTPGTGAVTVTAFAGASTAVKGKAASGNSRTASVTLPVTAGSVAWAVGLDPRTNGHRSVPAGQELVSEVRSGRRADTYWVQRLTAPVAATGNVTLSATGARQTTWHMIAVQVAAAKAK